MYCVVETMDNLSVGVYKNMNEQTQSMSLYLTEISSKLVEVLSKRFSFRSVRLLVENFLEL